jgi:hypothetical protein
MRKLFRKVKELEPLEINCGSGRTVRYRIWRVEGFQPNAKEHTVADIHQERLFQSKHF